MAITFREIDDGVFLLRFPILDVTSTLVVGAERALLIDTLSTAAQGRELRDAARRITPLPLAAALTHHHFDHCFGTAEAADPAASVWSHPACTERLARVDVDDVAADWPPLADELRATTLRLPDHAVRTTAAVDLGDRQVRLSHLGRGHTDNDLVAVIEGRNVIEGSNVIVAGDLVEESGPPSFEDSWPLEWAATLAKLLALTGPQTRIVPGHGIVVDRGFVEAQHAQLAELEWLCRDGHRDDRPVDQVAAAAPFPPEAALLAVQRAYADLDGRL